MDHSQKTKNLASNGQNARTQNPPKKSLQPPAFQLSSMQPETVQMQSQDQAPSSSPDLTARGSLDLRKQAVDLHADFAAAETHSVDKFMAAQTLTQIFAILQDRSEPYMLEGAHNPQDEIWDVYGGYGDPLIGRLESFTPFTHIFEWEQAIRSLDPGAWNEQNLHASYLGKRGHAIATRGGAGVEDERSKIGKDKHMPHILSGTQHDAKKKDDYKKRTGGKELKTPVVANPNFDLTVDDLFIILGKKEIWSQTQKKSIKLEDHRGDLELYVKHLKDAIRMAKIDTLQAQSSYIAHAAGEMLFSILSEGQNAPFINDPKDVEYTPGLNGPIDYSVNGSLSHARNTVDPLNLMKSHGVMKQLSPEERTGILNQTFIGRGPVQVTHDYGYVRSLIVLEELAKTTEDPTDAKKLWKAVADIKADPSAAAKPEYSFLFSAAFMHHNRGLTRSGDLGSKISTMNPNAAGMTGSQKNLLDWVSGGLNYPEYRNKGKNPHLEKSVFEAANHKIEAYNRTYELLKNKMGKP